MHTIEWLARGMGWLTAIGTGGLGVALGAEAVVPTDLSWISGIGEASASVILIGVAGMAMLALIRGNIVPAAQFDGRLSKIEEHVEHIKDHVEDLARSMR
jgi:hypothetical protein